MAGEGEKVAQWVQDQSARAIAVQRATADGAKVTATFTCSVAAALVATALQVGDRPSWADLAAVAIWLGSCWRTYRVFVADELEDVSHAAITGSAIPAVDQLRQLRQNLITLAAINEGRVRLVLTQLTIQIIWTLGAAMAALTSLLWTKCPRLDW